MKWLRISKLSSEEFRRLTGVKRQTFEEMIKLMEVSRAEKKAKGVWWTPKPVPVNKMLFFSRRGEKNGKCTKELHGSGEGKNRARSVKRKFNTNTTNLKIWGSRHASVHLEKSIIKGSA